MMMMMKYQMWKLQCVLALISLHVGLSHSWDIAIGEGELLKFYTDGDEIHTVKFNSQNLSSLVYDDVHNMMLYVDKQTDNDAIRSYNLSSLENKYLTERNGRKIHSLAYDPATETLFFTDTNERSINWVSLKPGSVNNVYGNLLIKMDDGIPTDIAVDSCERYIYWMNTNLTRPSIEKACFNGTGREVVIDTVSLSINTSHKLESHSLIIDQNTHKMYWYEPHSPLLYRTHSADLDGRNKYEMSPYPFTKYEKLYDNPSHTMTISKNGLISWGWCSRCEVWEEPKIKTASNPQIKSLFTVDSLYPVGITANYKIEDLVQGIQGCEALTNLVQNNSVINEAFENATDYDGPFCVHGMKVIGQSVCNCTLGYTGERCDVSVCENYCLQGNCSFSDEGLPECRCDTGYSGKRCEVDVCYGYCSNNGICFLNEKSEPVCECNRGYVGNRCDVTHCLNYCLQGNCSLNDVGLPECRCNAGYSGDRCAVNACHGYCLNNGTCSLNAENEPVCLCVDAYEGSRCETAQHSIVTCSNNHKQYSTERNVTLTDLLLNCQKPTKISITVEA